MELAGDLLRRAPLLQKMKHLDLTGREVWVRRSRRLVGTSLQEPEDTDYPLAAHQRNGADVDVEPRALGRDQDTGGVRGRGGPEHLPREQLACAAGVLGRDDGREVAAANITDETLGCRIDPPDDSRRVEDIARDADAAQSLLDIAADTQAACRPGHAESVADPAEKGGPVSRPSSFVPAVDPLGDQ